MNLGLFTIAVLLIVGSAGEKSLEIEHQDRLGFDIQYEDVFDEKVQMFCSLMDSEQKLVSCSANNALDLIDQILPLDIHCYYEDKREEEYYTLLTKTVYGINKNISFFTKERLSHISYLQDVMPHNNLRKEGNHYELKVGFGAPDISYTLDVFDADSFNASFPGLEKYFAEYDHIELDPQLIVVQHNFDFSKVLGQETSKMSISISRYFEYKTGQTLIINYTLNLIYNLPPKLFGGGELLVNQMKKGIVALVRDTRIVCQKE